MGVNYFGFLSILRIFRVEEVPMAAVTLAVPGIVFWAWRTMYQVHVVVTVPYVRMGILLASNDARKYLPRPSIDLGLESSLVQIIIYVISFTMAFDTFVTIANTLRLLQSILNPQDFKY